ncbi:MAG: hypothetical protein IJN29_05715 [Akkermansia sp.]|nr:hypothetical protein [Akkermansia sp.]
MISTTATAFRRMMKKILPLIGSTLCFAGTEDSLTDWEDDEEQTGIDWPVMRCREWPLIFRYEGKL